MKGTYHHKKAIVMNSYLHTVGICMALFLLVTCTDDDSNDTDNSNIPRMYSNYSLLIDGISYTHSDEDMEYDFCTDISTRSIYTSKFYDISTVKYEVVFSSFNATEQPEVFSYGFYVYWNTQEPDLPLYDAVADIIQGNSARNHRLQFVVQGEEGINYSNSSFLVEGSTDIIDESSIWELDIFLPENIECQIYGRRVAELNYQYTGFVYSRERRDSMFVDHFDLQLFVPLSL